MNKKELTNNLTERKTVFALLVWGLGVTAASFYGIFQKLPLPSIAFLVALGIIIPTIIYFTNEEFRGYIASLGLKKLTILHLWRIGAGAMFLFYGSQSILPETFVRNAGYGDIAVGLLVFVVLLLPESLAKYWVFHIFGMLDFIVAVGTGLTFTLLEVPLMKNLVELPIVLIPLYGVGISGATHIFAFTLLWKQRRTRKAVEQLLAEQAETLIENGEVVAKT